MGRVDGQTVAVTSEYAAEQGSGGADTFQIFDSGGLSQRRGLPALRAFLSDPSRKEAAKTGVPVIYSAPTARLCGVDEGDRRGSGWPRLAYSSR